MTPLPCLLDDVSRGPRSVVVGRLNLLRGARTVAAAATCLAPGELARAERGTDDVRGRRILLRAALRQLLGEVLGVDPREVPLADRPGRPALEPPEGRSGLDASCSASGTCGVVAVGAGTRIGIDVQQVLVEDLATAVAEGWLSPRERNGIARLPATEQPEALTRAWVQKEAVLKGEGVGLLSDPALTVTPLRNRGRTGHWAHFPIAVPVGYLASLAVRNGTLTAFCGRPPRLPARRTRVRLTR